MDNINIENTFRLDEISIVEIKDCHTKSVYTKAILEKLPEWFGNKQALDDYVVMVKELPYWVALNKKNNCIGFFSVKIHTDIQVKYLCAEYLPNINAAV